MPQPSIRNPVLETNLARLSRYGYHRGPSTASDTLATEWARLKGDFAELDRTTVPDFDDLPPNVQGAARHYLDLKREADQLLSNCETAHSDILAKGLDVARVEDYAMVRDAYEDKVEKFGAARRALSEVLAKAGS